MAGRSGMLAAALFLSAAVAAGAWAQSAPTPNHVTSVVAPLPPPTLKLHVLPTTLRLFQANCLTNCWLSQLFMGTARAVPEPVKVTNISTGSVLLTARLVPMNGAALGKLDAVRITRGSSDGAGQAIEVKPGGHVDLCVIRCMAITDSV